MGRGGRSSRVGTCDGVGSRTVEHAVETSGWFWTAWLEPPASVWMIRVAKEESSANAFSILRKAEIASYMRTNSTSITVSRYVSSVRRPLLLVEPPTRPFVLLLLL